jgi:GT2 family glycosyltransferase
MPRFSVIVPTYRRPDALRACLTALLMLETPRERFEVIVVDDGSPSPSRALASEFEKKLNLTLLVQTNAGPATARNAGATAIGGQTLNALSGDSYSSASQLLIDYLYLYYRVDGSEGRFFTTSNFALRREQFDELGGFDESFPLAAAEDREFCERWRAHGYELLYAADVIVRHAHVLTLRGFWRQHFNYGRGAVYLHRARKRRGAGGVRLEPLRFYRDLVTFPLRRGFTSKSAQTALLMLLSQVAYGAGYYRERLLQSASRKAAPAGPVRRDAQEVPAELP